MKYVQVQFCSCFASLNLKIILQTCIFWPVEQYNINNDSTINQPVIKLFMMQGVVTNSGMGLWNSALMPAWMCVTCIGSGVSQLSTSGVWLWLYKATSWHLFLCSAVLLCHVHVVRSWDGNGRFRIEMLNSFGKKQFQHQNWS